MERGKRISRRTWTILAGSAPAAAVVSLAAQPPAAPQDSVAAEVAASRRRNSEAIRAVAVPRETEPALRFQA